MNNEYINNFEPLFPASEVINEFQMKVSDKELHAIIKYRYIVFNESSSEVIEAQTVEEALSKASIKNIIRVEPKVEEEIVRASE